MDPFHSLDILKNHFASVAFCRNSGVYNIQNGAVIELSFVVVVVVVVCLLRPMEGMGRLQFSNLFSQNCQFRHRRLESLEHLMCLIYILLSTTVSQCS